MFCRRNQNGRRICLRPLPFLIISLVYAKHTPWCQSRINECKLGWEDFKNDADIMFENADKLLKFERVYAIIILHNDLDGVTAWLLAITSYGNY